MSRWYDQHRVNKRLRRLERTVERTRQRDLSRTKADLMQADSRMAVDFGRMAIGDAMEARERPPAFLSDESTVDGMTTRSSEGERCVPALAGTQTA